MARLPEAYQWLLAPVQQTPQSPLSWEAHRLSGQEPLAVRAARKLKSQDLLFLALSGTRLRMDLDRVPLWRGEDVSLRQLIDNFARYLYLPRLGGPEVLIEAIQDGLGLLLWRQESFAYADGKDEATGRYRGLRAGARVSLVADACEGLLVHPDVAARQLAADAAAQGEPPPDSSPDGPRSATAAMNRVPKAKRGPMSDRCRDATSAASNWTYHASAGMQAASRKRSSLICPASWVRASKSRSKQKLNCPKGLQIRWLGR